MPPKERDVQGFLNIKLVRQLRLWRRHTGYLNAKDKIVVAVEERFMKEIRDLQLALSQRETGPSYEAEYQEVAPV